MEILHIQAIRHCIYWKKKTIYLFYIYKDNGRFRDKGNLKLRCCKWPLCLVFFKLSCCDLYLQLSNIFVYLTHFNSQCCNYFDEMYACLFVYCLGICHCKYLSKCFGGYLSVCHSACAYLSICVCVYVDLYMSMYKTVCMYISDYMSMQICCHVSKCIWVFVSVSVCLCVLS